MGGWELTVKEWGIWGYSTGIGIVKSRD